MKSKTIYEKGATEDETQNYVFAHKQNSEIAVIQAKTDDEACKILNEQQGEESRFFRLSHTEPLN